jgi:hypothetical protein
MPFSVKLRRRKEAMLTPSVDLIRTYYFSFIVPPGTEYTTRIIEA